MSVSTVLAKALFDNTAESPEELAFRKGDILMVLEQEQSGGPGWWLCSLHGRQGIAPANRLRLLQTAPATSCDSVYLSPGPPLLRGSADDAEAVYRSPPAAGEGRGDGTASRPGELRKADVGRPRSHSSSGSRPRPDWEIGVASRPRSPSLRGRGTDVSGALYQTPVSPLPSSAQHARQPGAQMAPESVYLSPSGVARVNDEDTTYLVPRETTGPSDDCYLVPKGTPLAGEDVYQTPTGGVLAACPHGPSSVSGTHQSKVGQDIPGMYQTPSPVAVSLQRTLSSPAQAPPRPLLKGPSPNPAVARGKPGLACPRESPLLVRAAHPRVPGSPNFARKPPPPAPPVRGVTRKDGQPSTPMLGDCGVAPSPGSQAHEANRQTSQDPEKGSGALNSKAENQDYADPANDQVYDTPPSSRWQRAAPTVLSNGVDGIYDTPRTVPPHVDSETEVYDVPTVTLNGSTSEAQPGTADADDVYSVPTLPGLPAGPAESAGSLSGEEASQNGQTYCVASSEKRASAGDQQRDSPDCGIYDMPAPNADVFPHSSSSSSASTRRLSVSSNGSGDVQWRASLSSLVHAALSAASCSPAALLSRDLAASLAEILSAWKASHSGDPPPPLQQAWARLSDLLPALSAMGGAPPSEGLLSLVQRSLEESALLLQSQGRPRLPSQESLSRRPLPALPVLDGKSPGGGMGSRKSSWIQERPLPPTPLPAFPVPPASAAVTLAVGHGDGDEDPSNEYAGIGLTPVPALVPNGDSVGYVKLQGKPELPLAQNGQTITSEPRLTPSPPLPVSLSLEDSELLRFYSSQSLAHLSCLADAIDVLFASVRGNQPPRVFVARGKSLIVTAHKLVFIGDTLSRLLTSGDLRAKITTSGGRLCQALKAVVVATKGAAQNYPSVSASQEMVDRVAELSQQAAGFSALLQRLTEISS
ncbi:embryonal Fyn-associated substrate [Hippocampus zosterae]|uniref:embryonal Fyn-associated substrate n=1 Tax=Hippocampus zosterae TaxID=109293 RepID=UPI00223E366C|nr:embryonal Fyn-associated substrate [Hippocampus zosterae]XP_051922150.1 embryonal Fyn-associated substrate [Hippocampus zosterae]